MTTQTEPPDGEAILKEMVKQIEHIFGFDWPAGIDLSKQLRACSPANIRSLAAHVATLTAERDAARAALERDRSFVCDQYREIETIINGYEWTLSGRGSYAWDDDKYRDEFKNVSFALSAALEPLKSVIGDWSNCPTDHQEINEARRDVEVERDTALARVSWLEKLNHVPGKLACPKCKFELISMTLHVGNGAVSANNKSDVCPNGCGPLWKVSERAERELWSDIADKQFDEIQEMKKIIAAYVHDEDRRMNSKGEAFGSITTEIGIAARAALKEKP